MEVHFGKREDSEIENFHIGKYGERKNASVEFIPQAAQFRQNIRGSTV
jgi:hypothetical protein